MYTAYIGFSEYDHDVVLKFQGYGFETAKRFWHASLAAYFNTDDENYLNGIEEKIRCLSYAYLIDRSIRRGLDEEGARTLWMSRLTEILPRVDSLEFEAGGKGGASLNELEIEADTANLEKVTGFVDERLDAIGCPMKPKMQIDVAVEEIFVNIAHYAYTPGKGSATVRVEVSDDPVTVSITFIDRGVPYDPLKKEDPDVTLSAEERGIGGLGIFMTKKIMDDVSYEYKNGQNILTLRKKI